MSQRGKGNNNPTMVDVAKEAGVSLKTVSRVLNGEEYVRDETKQSVLRAAEKLNYTLNHAARALRAGSARIVALLFDNPSRSYLDNVHLGALGECHKHGMQLILDECKLGLSDVRNIVEKISPVGVILTPPLSDDKEVIQYLQNSDIEFVLIAPGEDDNAALSVSMDDRAAAQEITEYLIEKGHERIGFIKGHPDHYAAQTRFDGFKSALKNANIEIDDNLIKQGYFDYASGLSCAEELLDVSPAPTVIFSSNDDMAAAVIAAAYARQIAVPQQLSVVGFDDTQIAAIISPHLTTVRQPIAELAAAAVVMLAEHISPLKDSESQIVLDYQIVERDSVQAV